MPQSSHPWPLSELTPEDAENILALPPRARDARILKLKRDIASGAHARSQRWRAASEAE